MLSLFEDSNVNLTRIESRPSRSRPWHYVFLVDIEGHRQDSPVSNVIEKLRSHGETVKILGSYPRFTRP